MFAVLFSDEHLMLCAPGLQALDVLKFWGVPFAMHDSTEGLEICRSLPAESILVVCDKADDALKAQRSGHPVVFVGPGAGFIESEEDIVIGSLIEFADAVRPRYTRTALDLRNIIASEFGPL
ncbi:MAG: hypothetical protein M3126_03810 [Candidatus Eremiobacteraeota bacterium]|nr:hypothetical protein [Candidatus Eremiobacteraeota bacterium]